MKTIQDFKAYLDEVENLSKNLNEEQKKELENILSVVLTLIICLKKESNLGQYNINFIQENG